MILSSSCETAGIGLNIDRVDCAERVVATMTYPLGHEEVHIGEQGVCGGQERVKIVSR